MLSIQGAIITGGLVIETTDELALYEDNQDSRRVREDESCAPPPGPVPGET